MDSVVLSLKSLREESLELAKCIEVEFKPDLVVYIARGGYLIGKEISDYFHVPCIGIHAEREGGKLKDFISPLLRLLPKRIKIYLRELELSSGVHEINKDRQIYWDVDNKYLECVSDKSNILVVDDSVDTGYSMLQVVDEISRKFVKATIKTAAINVWNKSAEVCKINFSNHKNTIITTPMSTDSKEYPLFESLYENRDKK